MSETRSTENGRADEFESGRAQAENEDIPAGLQQGGPGRGAATLPGRPSASPMVRRHVLAGELRKLRYAARLTHADIAARLGWPQAKVSKIEGARQHVGVDAVIALADICHAPSEHRDRLVALAHSARQRGWWESYRDVLPADVRQHIGFEAEAAVVRSFATETVPELVQTGEYAAAVRAVRPADGSAAEVERSLEVLRRRQQRVESGEVRLDLILAESSLRREVGGRDVLERQRGRLRELARSAGLTVRVLPFSAGALATDTPFSLLSFELDHPETVVSTFGSNVGLTEDPDAVQAHRNLLQRLRTVALPPDDSIRWLEAAGTSAAVG